MSITAAEAKMARANLGLSQAAVCKATGIPRNIMSAFEQRKIVLLDDMQAELAEFFESKGYSIEEVDEVSDPDSVVLADEEDLVGSAPRIGDLVFRDGFCIPQGLDLDVADELLDEVHEIEGEIDANLETPVKDGALFFGFEPTERSQALNERLILLHARLGAIVRSIQGRGPNLYPSSDTEAANPPAVQRDLLIAKLSGSSRG